jgi:signal transduction histidine kinase
VALDPQSSAFVPIEIALPGPVTVRRSFSTMAAVDFGLPGEWVGRIYLFDPAHMPHGLHFLESLTDSVTPVLSNVFLLRRLRSRVGAAERARVARELHDGAIQALRGIEMDAQAIRATAESMAPALGPHLQRIQGLLRQEVLALRELMQQLQPVDLETPHHLPELLGALVERFRRDTGIAARFIGDATTDALTLRSTHEIVRIVQEALANVRKHSQARNVVVELTERDGGLCVSVEDDGRGFAFDGTLSGSDLLASRMAPAVIFQRARLLGGTMTIASTPGAGARIEVAFSGVRQS